MTQPEGMTPRRILVVEDEALIADEIRDRLIRMGHEVVDVVDTAVAAVRSTDERRPDLVLMDIHLKGVVDGIEAGRIVTEVLHTPVIYLTAYSDEATVQRATPSAMGYLLKPFQETDLRIAIRMAMHRHAILQGLKDSELTHEAILTAIADGVVAVDAEGQVRFLNAAAESLMGLGTEESHGASVGDVFKFSDPRSGKALPSPIMEALTSGTTINFEECLLEIGAGSAVRSVEGSAAPITRSTGHQIGAAAAFRDVTARREAAESARKYEELLGSLLERTHIPMLVVTGDTPSRVLSANESFSELFGYTVEDVPDIEAWWFRAYPDPVYRADVRTRWDDAIKTAERESKTAIEPVGARVVCKNGSTREVTVYMATFGGRSLVLFNDLTERLKLESDLRQSRKMEALGQMAGRVAHDFNNLLTVINGYSELLSKRLSEQPDLRRQSDLIRRAGKTAAEITDHLLAFSQKRITEPVPLALNTLLEEYTSMLQHLAGPAARLQWNLDPELCQISSTSASFEQIMINLVANARDAMPRGGTITVSTANTWVANKSGPKRLHVRLSVKDTGVGMEPELIDRIFDPFFTTKAEGKGTGLGLATVYGITKQRGGWIEVDSELGEGTTFRLYFPASVDGQRPLDGPNGTRRDAFELPLPMTVLLAEDDAAVREYCSLILRSRGCTVLTAENGTEALAASREFAGHIDLLLSDVVMPDITGPQVAERLIEERPGLTVLFMTGYAADTVHAVLQVAVIAKPFDEEHLLEAILAALGHGRGDRPDNSR